MMGLHRTDLVSTVERADVGRLLYGAVVSGGALSAISAHSDETPRVALATFLVVVVYVAASALGAEPPTAGFIALGALTLMLLVVGYLGAFRAGLRGTAAALEASGAGLFGLLMIGLKAFLH